MGEKATAREKQKGKKKKKEKGGRLFWALVLIFRDSRGLSTTIWKIDLVGSRIRPPAGWWRRRSRRRGWFYREIWLCRFWFSFRRPVSRFVFSRGFFHAKFTSARSTGIDRSIDRSIAISPSCRTTRSGTRGGGRFPACRRVESHARTRELVESGLVNREAYFFFFWKIPRYAAVNEGLIVYSWALLLTWQVSSDIAKQIRYIGYSKLFLFFFFKKRRGIRKSNDGKKKWGMRKKKLVRKLCAKDMEDR